MQGIASFNVTLTERQKEEKERVVLPYLKAQSLQELGPQTGMPTILYYADKADDIDEEDPDADLDIGPAINCNDVSWILLSAQAHIESNPAAHSFIFD